MSIRHPHTRHLFGVWLADWIKRHRPVMARVTWVGRNTEEIIEVTGGPKDLHSIQFGGEGDGYCYHHQSFGCFEDLTPKEWKAISQADMARSE